VALVVATGLALSVLSIAVAASVSEADKGRFISEAAATLLSTVLGAIVGAVATYLGATRPAGDTSATTSDEPPGDRAPPGHPLSSQQDD